MNAEQAQILELLAQCKLELAVLDRSCAEVVGLQSRIATPSDGSAEVILYGYHLHQWYSAAENLLLRIAAHFGNELDPTEWHRGLLERLKLDVPDLRPPVLSGESFEHLNALRGFRHVFRHAYDYTLKWDLMRSNVLRLPAAHQSFTRDARVFLTYLEQLADQTP